MQVVLVQLQQEHDQHKQGVDHEEGKHGIVPQLLQIGSNTVLWWVDKALKILLRRANVNVLSSLAILGSSPVLSWCRLEPRETD